MFLGCRLACASTGCCIINLGWLLVQQGCEISGTGAWLSFPRVLGNGWGPQVVFTSTVHSLWFHLLWKLRNLQSRRDQYLKIQSLIKPEQSYRLQHPFLLLFH